jgi:hypothetical protein
VSREPNAPNGTWPDEPEELAPLDPAVEHDLLEAIRAAWDPAPLDPTRHRQILEVALEDPFAEPTEDEVRESARLRRALEEGDTSHPDAELARALRSAVRPSSARPEATGATPHATGRGAGRVVYATFGAVALAAAAGFALFVARPRSEPEAQSAAPARARHASRPTGELFAERFKTGGTTERIDRIALARAHDLRENRYASWGVR